MNRLLLSCLTLALSLPLPSLCAQDQEEAKAAEVKVDTTVKQGADLPDGAKFPLPLVDLSDDTARQVVVAAGTPEIYQGHPTTALLPDGKTMYVVWTYKHGGPCGPLKRSDDAGRTWSELLPVPENWSTVKNAPAIYRLTDPQGQTRLFVYAGQGPDGTMQESHSDDDGKTWTPMKSLGITAVVPFMSIAPIEGGKKLLGLTNIRRPGETKERNSNVIAQSFSSDGGLTWSPLKVILDLPGLKPCEPAIIRSPDGKQLLCLMRENEQRRSLFITSDDEGQTWSTSKPAPIGLAGDRHVAKYAPDGRLVVTFRNRATQSGMFRHFGAWVGRYEDIVNGGEGEYVIKLLHSFRSYDNGYSGLELLPDGTFVTVTYIKYRRGPELNSLVGTRFRLEETDKLAKNPPPAGTPTPVP